MKIEYPIFYTDARGKLGNHIFSRNQYGPYRKDYAVPIQPNTLVQVNTQNDFQFVTSRWSQLSESQRLQWFQAVSNLEFRKAYLLSDSVNPKNAYVSINYRQRWMGFAIFDVPPVPSGFGSLRFDRLRAQGSPYQLQFFANQTAVNTYMLIFATPILSTSINYFKNRVRFLGRHALDSGVVGNFSNRYANKYGTPPVGSRVGFSVFFYKRFTGEITPRFYLPGNF